MNDVIQIKVTPDGREVCVQPRMFNSIITIGRVGDMTLEGQW